MHRLPQRLRPDIHMHNHALRLPRQPRVPVRHGHRHHFVGTCEDAWELAFFLLLAFDDGFDDAGVVGTEVDEAVGYAGLCFRWSRLVVGWVLLGEGKGWGKGVRTSQRASKKAKEAV